MLRPTLVLVAAGALFFSCAKESPGPEPSPDPEPEAAAQSEGKGQAEEKEKSNEPACDERMDQFAVNLEPVGQGRASLAVPEEITPIEATTGSPIQPFGPIVVVGRGGRLTLDGQPLAGIRPGLKERLLQTLESMRMRGRKGPVYIWADETTSAKRVAKVAAAVPAELEARLLLAGPKPETTRYEARLLEQAHIRKVSEAIDGAGPAEKATLVAKELEKAIGLCAPLVKAFGSVASMAPSKRGEYIAETAPEAIRECRCEVGDLDLLEYLLLATFGAFDRPVRWISASDAPSVLSR